ncbi:MAG: hypothetical protein H6817_09305 [Phycisphaerales bacterium]|nr:hypothetical protein [Phycisphaerales bacterium]
MSARRKCTCSLAACCALMLFAQFAVAQPVCPMPNTAPPLCASLQTSDCISSDPSSECLPRQAFNIPTGPPAIIECGCTTYTECGEMDIRQDSLTGEWNYRCVGQCPIPGEQCELYADGISTGQSFGGSFSFPPDALMTCECPKVTTDFCPLASPLCQQLAQTDCISTDPTVEACWPKAISGNAAGQPNVDACECFTQEECGPIHVIPIGQPPIDYEYSCIGVCTNGAQNCEVFFDNGSGPMPLGTSVVLASSVPPGVTVTCDCPETQVDEACCVQLSCFQTPPADCLAIGGTPQGPGSVCSGTIEACCLPDDTCVDLDPLCCDDLGGTSYGAGSACLGDNDGDGKDDLCSPPVEPCPLSADQLCANFQSTQCANGNATDECTPTTVMVTGNSPNGTSVVAEACDCADFTSCGPVHVDPIGVPPFDYRFSCLGACPPGQTGECLVHINGQSTGQVNVTASTIPVGSLVTCDCDDPIDYCPLGTDFCANFQQTDCVSTGSTAEACWPKAIGGGSGFPEVLACSCYDDVCGPVHIEDDPTGVGFVYSCPGPCPDPNLPCQIHFDNGNGPMPTGQTSINSFNVPAGVVVTCDCPKEEDEGCCLPDGTCANMPPSACIQLMGTPQGAGTACTGIVEACCLPDDTCVDVDRLCCDDLGGTPQGPGSACLGDSDGDGKDDLCSPPVEYCPLSSDQLCANLQFTDCLDGGADDKCTPLIVITSVGPAGEIGAFAELCDCVDFTSCGPVQVDPIGSPPQDYVFSCSGACPPGHNGECVVFANGVSTGAVSINASSLPLNSQVTCDCDEPVDYCPLATDYCANFQFTDCVSTNSLASACWPSSVGGSTAGAPEVLACDCFAEECGPVQIDPGPGGQGYIYSCPGPCPDPDRPCEIFLDDGTGPKSTGKNDIFSLDVPPGVIVTCDCGDGGQPIPVTIEWSIDIGSDTELSDPNADGDEGADPGDVYMWQSAPYRAPGQPCGRDGFKDDAFIFGFDPAPSAPDCASPPATAVPVGSGIDPNDGYAQYFDLDGHDQTDFNIQQFVLPDVALDQPIPQGAIAPNSACVFPPDYLLYSYDDDRAPGWPSGNVPVTSLSPAGRTYGKSKLYDEVIGKSLTVALPLPFSTALDWKLTFERGVHSDMGPNPDTSEKDDDDVDSLDAVRSASDCPYWYYSADHEAHFGLDPGDIYLASGGLIVKVIDEAIHLGLPESTDIDAFEFTWLPVSGAAGPAFAVLFSVDEDDPLTPLPIDESGGLDPKQIYGSFLTGSSFPVIVAGEQPKDDIDALTIWVEELLPRCVASDVNCDGSTNAGDIGIVASAVNFGQDPPACDRADTDGSGGPINAGDIGVIVSGANFGTNTGPCICDTATPVACGVP